MSKYHPDRVEGLGIELRELAERKAKELNQAYTSAKQHRGFK
jgi:DnaJ like chaperone protein